MYSSFSGLPLPLATIFLHVVVKDYVPDGLSEFADALANPIKYQSDLEKRTHQLAVLIEGLEPTEQEEQKKNSLGRVSATYLISVYRHVFIYACIYLLVCISFRM